MNKIRMINLIFKPSNVKEIWTVGHIADGPSFIDNERWIVAIKTVARTNILDRGVKQKAFVNNLCIKNL